MQVIFTLTGQPARTPAHHKLLQMAQARLGAG